MQPGPQRRPALEIAVGPPGPDEGLLHLVLGVVDRAEHPVAVRQQLGPERLGQPRELLAAQHRLCLPRAACHAARTRHRYRSAAAAKLIGPPGGEFRPPPGSVPVDAGNPRSEPRIKEYLMSAQELSGSTA